MTLNTKVYRDFSGFTDEALCRCLRRTPAVLALPLILATIAFTVAYRGGTTAFRPWQLYFAGSEALAFLALILVGHIKVAGEFERRLKDKASEHQNPELSPAAVAPDEA